MSKRYVLSAEIDRVKAKHPPLELLLPAIPKSDSSVAFDEKTVVVAPPQLFSDDVVMFASTEPVRAAALLLGGDYEQFKAGGGSATILFQILEEHAKAPLGE